MVTTRLYTPGHNLVTDTLIMHGIVRYLLWAGVSKGVVRRIGDRFVIDIEEEISKDKERKAINQLITIQRAGVKTIEYDKPTTKFFEKIYRANINEPVFWNWVRSIVDSITKFDTILIYQDPDHKIKANEGRRRSRTGATVYLPLGPLYGKYEYADYNVKEGVQYTMCSSCFLMANLGLVYGSYVLRTQKGDKIYSIILNLIPSQEASIVDIALIQRAFEIQYKEERDIEVPILAVPLIALSYGETLYGFEGMDAIVWINERSGNFQRVPYFTTFNVDKVYKVISVIKIEVPDWPRIIEDYLLTEDGLHILAYITETILGEGVKEHIYTLTRLLEAYVRANKKDIPNISRGLGGKIIDIVDSLARSA